MATHCSILKANVLTQKHFRDVGVSLFRGSQRMKAEWEGALDELIRRGYVLACPVHDDCVILAGTVEPRGVAATRDIRDVWRIEYRPYRREQAWVWRDESRPDQAENWQIAQFCPTWADAQNWVASHD